MAYTLKHKTQLYHQMYTSYKAGLPLAVMLTPELLPASFSKNAAQMQRMLEKGRPLSSILTTVKLIAPWEAKLLATGEESGRLEVVLGDLEAFFAARLQQVNATKARLLYPLLVLVIAFLLGPVPALAGGKLTFAAYVGHVGLKLGLFYLLYKLVLLRTLESAEGGAFNPLLLRAARWAGSDHWLRKLFEISYLNLLTACLEAGVDAAETLRLLRDTLADKTLRKQHLLALNNVYKHGMSLAQALTGSGILRNYQVVSFFSTAEQAGALHSDMRQFVLKQRSELAALVQFKLKVFAKWLYIAMLLMAVGGFF